MRKPCHGGKGHSSPWSERQAWQRAPYLGPRSQLTAQEFVSSTLSGLLQLVLHILQKEDRDTNVHQPQTLPETREVSTRQDVVLPQENQVSCVCSHLSTQNLFPDLLPLTSTFRMAVPRQESLTQEQHTKPPPWRGELPPVNRDCVHTAGTTPVLLPSSSSPPARSHPREAQGRKRRSLRPCHRPTGPRPTEPWGSWWAAHRGPAPPSDSRPP